MSVIRRLFVSRKFITALLALAGVIAVQGFGLDPETTETIIHAIELLALAVIGTWAGEDIAAKLRGKQ